MYAGHVVVDARARVVGRRRPPSPSRVLANLRRWNPVPAGASNVVVRRCALEELGGFDPTLPSCGDWDLWLRASLRTITDRAEFRRLERRHRFRIDWAQLYRWPGEVAVLDGERRLALRLYAFAARHEPLPWGSPATRAELAWFVRDTGKVLLQRFERVKPHGSEPLQGPSSPSAWCRQAQTWLAAMAPIVEPAA